jgi:uncharacterized protein (DUF2237 family)
MEADHARGSEHPRREAGDVLHPADERFYRTGCCETGPEDVGDHVVCPEMTEEFLAFSKTRGNVLSTPVPEIGFPGLQPGDRWCLCALEGGARCRCRTSRGPPCHR